MVKKTAPGRKLTVKTSNIKDLKVSPGKDKQIKGGVGKLSKPSTPSDPGCTPC